MSSYLTEAMVYERINRYQAEAAEHRRASAGRPDGPSVFERIGEAIERGFAATSRETANGEHIGAKFAVPDCPVGFAESTVGRAGEVSYPIGRRRL